MRRCLESMKSMVAIKKMYCAQEGEAADKESKEL